jgi:hypothetical protein
MRSISLNALLIGIFMIALIMSIPAKADRAVIPFTDASVYGPGQKAIIAWDGETERMLLSTDVYANKGTKALELLPLPSEPLIEEGSFKSFESIEHLMIAKAPKVKEGAEPPSSGLEVVFHKKIGAHDISVVRVSSLGELVKEILIRFGEGGASQGIQGKVRDLLNEYLIRGFNYWVFDSIDLTEDEASIQPLFFEFRSSFLYYPMKVSSLASGRTKILLFIITKGTILYEEILPQGMSFATYTDGSQICFQLSKQELKTIDEKMAEMFEQSAWLSVVKYEGDLSDLNFDLEYRPDKCSSIKLTVDKPVCGLGEEVAMTVDFIHLLPGCYEAQVLHFHLVRLEILDSSGRLIDSWQWEVNNDLHKTIYWRPTRADTYQVKASVWFNGMTLQMEDSQTVKVIEKTKEQPTQLPFCWVIAILLILAVLAGIGMGWLLAKCFGKSR